MKQEVIFTTTEYVICFDKKLMKIAYVAVPDDATYFHFSDEILEKALRAFCRTNWKDFDIMTCWFYLASETEKERYLNVAKKVFKSFFNELYNSLIADDVFGRDTSLASVDKVYDFFEDFNIC